MSSFRDAEWIKRLWSLARPGDPVIDYVAGVNVVNDGRYRGSREQAPYAHHSGFALGAGAGSHNFIEIGGTDPLAPPLNLLHQAVLETAMGNSLTGLVKVLVAPTGSLTSATRVAQTPFTMDSDPDVTPFVFAGTLLTANIPAAAAFLPRQNGVGQTNGTPLFSTSVTKLDPLVTLPFAAKWQGGSLFFFGGDNEFIFWQIAWQSIRA